MIIDHMLFCTAITEQLSINIFFHDVRIIICIAILMLLNCASIELSTIAIAGSALQSWNHSSHGFTGVYSCVLAVRYDEWLFFCQPFMSEVMMSTGTGKTMVLFFSADMLFRVCRYRSCKKKSAIGQKEYPANQSAEDIKAKCYSGSAILTAAVRVYLQTLQVPQLQEE